MFKKDISKLHTMAILDKEYIDSYLKNPKNIGYSYEYEVKNDDGLVEKYKYHISFDDTYAFSFSYEYEDSDKNKVNKYLKDNYLYVQTTHTSTKKALTSGELSELKVDILNKIKSAHEVSFSTITNSKNDAIKTGLNFSFSPFYFLGTKVQVDGEGKNATDYKFCFDLTGRLRKIHFEDSQKQNITIKLSEKSAKIKFPDFKDYTTQK